MHDQASFGRWLQRHRKELDLTQAGIADQIGCTAATIQKIEADLRRPSRQIAERLAALLEIPPNDRDRFVAWARQSTRPEDAAIQFPGSESAIGAAGRPAIPGLPAPPTPLIGREQQVSALRKLLLRDTLRLVTLTGAPGIGKTRLALQVATELHDDFLHGAVFVALAPIRDPGLVATTIARAFGIHEAGDRPIIELLANTLRDKHSLLVLDNFEHLLSAAPLLAEILSTCPRLKLLITSQARLHLSGEHEFVVPPLALPDLNHLPPIDELARCAAVQVFLQRTQAINSDFELTAANASSVAAICVRLDGLPLAIELAATRTRLFTPQTLLERLHDRLAVLTGGPQDLPDHQQTLRSAIARSHELLTGGEQELFRRLSIFAGGCTLAAVEAVCQEPTGECAATILDRLASLIDKSLLRRESGDDEPRFAMLETIREYALEQLQHSGEDPILRQQHAVYYLALVEAAAPRLFEEQQGTWLAQLDREHDNLRVALRWTLDQGHVAIAARIGKALWWFWLIHGHLSEGRRWLDAILEQKQSLPAEICADLFNGAAALANEQGDYAAAQRLLQASLALHRRENNQMGIASTLGNLGLIAHMQGDHRQAIVFHEESLMLSQQLDDQRGVARTLSNLGTVAYTQGEYNQATDYLLESLALLREVGDIDGVASSLTNLGLVSCMQGNAATAGTYFAQSLVMYQELGRKQGIGLCLVGIAGVAGACGRPDLAVRLSGATTMLLDAIGVQLDRIDRANYERILAAAQEQLSPVQFATAWAEGQMLTLDQAIAEAMDIAMDFA
ncbi:MAG TPA: tetratricopeptide repeat protein [Herpetosiphonaceae bacterium]